MSDYISDFKNKLLPYAQRAGAKLSIPTEVVLSQWAWESNYGRSDLALKANNFGGIKDTKNSDDGVFTAGKLVYERYDSIDNFTNDYIRVMNLSYYDKVRSATDIPGTLSALGASPYAEDPYKDTSGKAGFGLMGVIQKLFGGSSTPSVEGMNLTQLRSYAALGIGALALVLAFQGDNKK